MSDDPTPPGVPDWMRAHMTSDERALGRVEGRLDAIEALLTAIREESGGRLASHGSRIRSLELWRAGLTGGGVLLAAIVSYLLGK